MTTRLEEARATDVAPGLVVGSYRVVSKLGEGGMGAVWALEHQTLGFRAALKTLPPGEDSAELVRRLQQEAHALAKLDRDARPALRRIPKVYDLGCFEDGRPWMIMEHVSGRSLDKVMKQTSP